MIPQPPNASKPPALTVEHVYAHVLAKLSALRTELLAIHASGKSELRSFAQEHDRQSGEEMRQAFGNILANRDTLIEAQMTQLKADMLHEFAQFAKEIRAHLRNMR